MIHSPLVEVKNLSKSYSFHNGAIEVLKEINLEICSGEFIAVMGPSGSGKSTLLHLLGCLDRATKGVYLLNNQDVSRLNDTELAIHRASRIGFIFQSFNLIPQLNVFQNLKIPFLYQPHLLEEEVVEGRILKAMEKVKLTHRMHHLPSQLSGGEMQRAAIARALAIEPLLILADEPTGNLDTETGKIILQLFEELNEQGATLIMVTHNEEIAARSQRKIYLKDGYIDKN